VASEEMVKQARANTLPPKVKAAVILFIEKRDPKLSQKLSGLDLEDFIETLRKARVRIT